MVGGGVWWDDVTTTRPPEENPSVQACEVFFEPACGQGGDLFEGARFFEQVGCARYDLEFLLRLEHVVGLAVKGEDRVVVAPHYEEGRGLYVREGLRGHVRPSSPGDDGPDCGAHFNGGPEGGRRPRGRAGGSDQQGLRPFLFLHPPCRGP